MTRFKRFILVAACLAAWSLVGEPALAAEVRAVKAWSRATPPGADTAPLYMTLRASGGDDRLVGVETDMAQMAMLHESEVRAGVASMRDLQEVVLPAGREVTLQPGGVHVMLMGLAHPLRRGEHFRATLQFAASPPITVEVAVAGIGAASPP